MCGNIKSKAAFFMRGAIFLLPRIFWCVRITKGESTLCRIMKKMYFTLFNKVSDIIEELKQIQCEMEEIAIEDSKNEE